MPTVTPSISTTIPGVPRVIWSGIITGDTIVPFTLTRQAGLAAAVQFTGTFGGASVKLQVSNDGTNWSDVSDIRGTSTSVTAAGYFELSVSGAYIQPVVTGGAANSINVTVVLRGD